MRALVLPVLAAATLLSACASSFPARVSRFSALPAPSGESFTIQARDPQKAGGLEFATYANLVSQRLAGYGYQPAASPAAATLVVTLDYNVDAGREKIASRPGFGYGGFGYGGFGYSRFGYGGWGRYGFPYRYGGLGYGGFYDPFWGGGFGAPEVYSYTQYDSELDMRIARRAGGTAVFEGRAEAKTRSDDLTRLVPNLVEAMFTNFPGRSGETVRVKVPQDRDRS